MSKTMNYTADQIKTLEGLEAIRQMPGMYVGSVTTDGLHHILKEIISNSIDEYINGSGDTIEVVLKKDGWVSVKDNARGIPIGIHSSGCSVLQAVFGIVNTGGKYTKDGENGYNTSGGQHGVGAKATNALSDYLIASTTREGIKQTVSFRRGQFVSEKQEKANTKNGTYVAFKPDATIFETVEFDFKRIASLLKEFAYLCTGLTLKLRDERTDKVKEEEFFSANGLADYIKDLNKGKQTITSVMMINSEMDKSGVDIALQYNTSYGDTVKLFTNMIPNTEGTHLTGFRSALTRTINQYARDKKILKEKDDNLSGEDLKEGQTLIINLKMLKPVFEGQHKEKLNSTEGRTLTEQLAAKELRVWLENNPNDAKTIIQKALLSRKAREAAKKAREAARKKSGSVLSSPLPGKLADCQSNDPSECEIYLVEGDSAAGTTKTARCRRTQAILPLRGKILNVEKAELSKAMANAEIKSMITAFGLQVNGNQITVDEDKLRYKKIIIMTDGDVDGSHIRILLLTFLWKFARDLITKGYVYCAMPPLYKVTKGKDNTYLLDDNALAQYKAKYPGAALTVSRFKGLGEMNAEQLEETTMNKENRILKQITVSDMTMVERVVQSLMGDSVSLRKQFIEENAREAQVDL